jgi:FtsZ-binding cell division protein ZapB
MQTAIIELTEDRNDLLNNVTNLKAHETELEQNAQSQREQIQGILTH